MESNFAYNHIQSINELKNMLIEHAVYTEGVEGITVYIDEEYTDEGIFRKYYVGEEEHPRCMIVSNDKGLYFYEKKDQNKD